MADPLSIVGTAISLAATIGRVVKDVEQFMRQVREARADMDGISRELWSLRAALEMLADDVKSGVTVPQTLEDILKNCAEVMARLDATLQKYNSERLRVRVKYVWSGKETISSYRSTLAAHKGALDLAVDLITLSLTREIKKDTNAILEDTGDIKLNTENILAEICRLQAQLPQGAQATSDKSDFILRKYLDELTSYAGSVVGDCDIWSTSDATIQEDTGPGRAQATVGPIDEQITPKTELVADNLNINNNPQWTYFSQEYPHSIENSSVARLEVPQFDGSQIGQPLAITPISGSELASTTLETAIKSDSKRDRITETASGSDKVWMLHESHLDRATERVIPKGSVRSALQLVERSNEGSTTSPPKLKAPKEMPASLSSTALSSLNQAESQTRPREHDEFTWREEFEHIGLEDTDKKRKREEFVEKFINVPDSVVAPKYGTAYQILVDYVVNGAGLHIQPILTKGYNENIPAIVKWVRQFTMSGGDVNKQFSLDAGKKRSNNRGTYAIIAALALRDSKWLDYLLKAGANVNVAGCDPWTVPSPPLFLKTVVLKPVGKSALSHALDWDVSTARKLVQAGAKPASGWSAELESIAATKTETLPMLEPGKAEDYLIYVAKFLLENGAEINFPGRPPLHICIESAGYASMVRFLLENGANPNRIYYSSGTPLHVAVKADQFDIIKILVDAGAKCDAKAKVSYLLGKSLCEEVVTPIELADRLGKLDLLNQALRSNLRSYRRGPLENAGESDPQVGNNILRVKPEKPGKAIRIGRGYI